MIMHWITTLFFWILFLMILKKIRILKDEGISYQMEATAFTIKVIAGIVYGYIDAYVFHGKDSMNYFWDSNFIFQSIHQNPLHYFQIITGIHDNIPEIQGKYYNYLITWRSNEFDYFFNDSRTFVRINAVIRLFSFGIYNVHVIVLSFLAFIGLAYIFKTFRKFCRLPSPLLFIILFYIPSMIIWTSAVMKEPLVMLGIGLFTFNFYKMTGHAGRPGHVAGFIFSILILIFLKFYILLCLIPGALLFWWLLKKPGRMLLKLFTVVAGGLMLAATLHYIVPGYNVSRILHDKLTNFVKREEYFNKSLKVEYTPLQPHLTDILYHSPGAFIKTLIAPTKELWIKKFKLIFVAENIMLLLIFGYVLLHFRKPVREFIPILVFSSSFIILLYTLIGLTIPFEGSIIRFKALAYPFIVFILLSFMNPEHLQSNKRLFSRDK